MEISGGGGRGEGRWIGEIGEGEDRREKCGGGGGSGVHAPPVACASGVVVAAKALASKRAGRAVVIVRVDRNRTPRRCGARAASLCTPPSCRTYQLTIPGASTEVAHATLTPSFLTSRRNQIDTEAGGGRAAKRTIELKSSHFCADPVGVTATVRQLSLNSGQSEIRQV